MVDVIDGAINLMPQGALENLQQQQLAQRPAPTAPAEPQPQVAEPTTQAQPRKYAGKYNSVEELEKGYWSSAQEAQRIVEENKMLKQVLTGQQRVNPAERVAEREAYVEELREAAIPVEALEKLIEARSRRVTRSELEPIARGAHARQSMLKTPGFAEAESAFDQFLSANPDVNEEYQSLMDKGLEGLALKHVFQSYRLQNGTAAADVSGQQQAMARATATLTGSQAGTREVVDALSKKLIDAQAQFEQDQDPRAYSAALFDVFKPIQGPQ